MTTDLRTVAKVVTAACGLVIALAGASAGWGALGWWSPASRAYVGEELAQFAPPLLMLMRSHRDYLHLTREGLAARQRRATDPQTRSDLQQLLDKADMELAGAGEMIATLERRR